MALQIWLPLTEDLRNLGLNGVKPTNSGSTLDASGKLGGCYKFTAATQKITIPWTATTNMVFSVGGWFKLDTIPTSGKYYYAISLGSGSGYSDLLFRFAFEPSYITAVVGGTGNAISKTQDTNWHFIYITCNGTNSKFYFDNEAPVSLSKGSVVSRTTLVLGNRNGGSDIHLFIGKINDFRYYDHCLSDLEVKEIAKGKILHLPLNDERLKKVTNMFTAVPTIGASNVNSNAWDKTLHKDSVTVSGWSTGYNSGVTNAATVYHAHWINMEGVPVMRFPYIANSAGVKPTWLGIPTSSINSTFKNLLVGLKYILSFDAKTDVTGTKLITAGLYYKKDSSSNATFHDGNIPQVLTTTWKRYTIQYTSTQPIYSITGFYFYGTCSGTEGNMYIKNPLLEIGDVAHDYTTTSKDGTAYDISGLHNDGTVTGELTFSDSTPRYNKCVVCGTGKYITREPLPALSVSLWIKGKPTSNQVVFADKSGLAFGFYNSNQLIVTAGGSSKPVYSSEPITNDWNHIVVINDNGTYKLYINGIEQSNIGSNNAWTQSYEELTIGSRHTGAGYESNYTGQISDFRMYATVLSNTDIQELYKLGNV